MQSNSSDILLGLKERRKKKNTLYPEFSWWTHLLKLAYRNTFRFSHIGEIQKEKARKPRLLLSLWMLHFLRTVRTVPVIFLELGSARTATAFSPCLIMKLKEIGLFRYQRNDCCICIPFKRAPLSAPHWRMKPYPSPGSDRHGPERLSNENGLDRSIAASCSRMFLSADRITWAALYSYKTYTAEQENLCLLSACVSNDTKSCFILVGHNPKISHRSVQQCHITYLLLLMSIIQCIFICHLVEAAELNRQTWTGWPHPQKNIN